MDQKTLDGLYQQVRTAFDAGGLPPMPEMEIDAFTLRYVSNEIAEQSLRMLWEERPDLCRAYFEMDIKPELREDENDAEERYHNLLRYIHNEIAPRIGGLEAPLACHQIVLKLRSRMHSAYRLPATWQELRQSDRQEPEVR